MNAVCAHTVRRTFNYNYAFKRLPSNIWASYSESVKALTERFEPQSKHELYTAKFQMRKREKAEGWADVAQDLRMLVDKVFPDLQEEARNQLSLNRYGDQITDTQINFAVKQRRPKTLEEAVTATLELESYPMPTTARESQVAMEHTLDITDGEEEGSSRIDVVGKRSRPASSDITGASSDITGVSCKDWSA